MRHRWIIEHGPRRLWWAPWRRICRCGRGAYPCYAERMRAAQAAIQHERPPWNAPTTVLRDDPLLTRGRRRRSCGSDWS